MVAVTPEGTEADQISEEASLDGIVAAAPETWLSVAVAPTVNETPVTGFETEAVAILPIGMTATTRLDAAVPMPTDVNVAVAVPDASVAKDWKVQVAEDEAAASIAALL
jgi:hypothetical protein